MKKAILLGLVTSSFLFANDYLPLSKISKDKKLEYNFITLDNTIIQASEINTKSSITSDGYETVQEADIVIPQKVEEKVQVKVKKKIAQKVIVEPEIKQEKIKPKKTELPKQSNLILKDEVKLNPEKTNVQLQRDLFFTAKITFSPVTADLSGFGTSLSDKSNVFIPEARIDINDHSFTAEYFTSKNEFSGINTTTIETQIQWFKGGYRYNIDNLSIGADLNYAVLDVNSEEDYNELYPSLEIDMNHNIDNISLNYGAGFGKNNNIDYSYDYFLNVGIKPYALSEASLVAGYKNRTIKDEDTKLEFSGPYLGVSSTF